MSDSPPPPPPPAPNVEEPEANPWWKQWWAIAGMMFLVVVVIGALTSGDDAADEPPASSTPSDVPSPTPTPTPSPTPTPAASTPSASPSSVPSPTPLAAEPTTPPAAVPTTASGSFTVEDRLILDDDPSIEISGITDVEESLATIVAEGIRNEEWGKYIDEVYVDEDLFISDVRVRLSILMDESLEDLTLAICEAAVAALPATDKALMVHIQPMSVIGGGQEIDGSATPWDFLPETLATGGNSSDCDLRFVSDSTMEKTEAYLADQD